MLTDKSTFVFFELEGEIFAINVMYVIQTLEMMELTQLPETPDFMKGITIFRGDILPIIDLRLKFNLDANLKDENSESYVIVTKYESEEKAQQVGFVVDNVVDVAEYSELDINSFPEIGSKYNIEFINGAIKRENDLAIILNIEKVLSSVEVAILKKSTEKLNLLKEQYGIDDE